MKLQCTREQLTGSDDTPILGFQLHGDALAAHAIMQALEDNYNVYAAQWVMERADALMQEWTK